MNEDRAVEIMMAGRLLELANRHRAGKRVRVSKEYMRGLEDGIRVGMRHKTQSNPKYQIVWTGRPQGGPRETWSEAAEDAVARGLAKWMGDRCLWLGRGVQILEVLPGLSSVPA